VTDHREAKLLGLAVEYLRPESRFWQQVWLLYRMYDFDSRRSGYLKVFKGRLRSAAVAVTRAAASAAA
jgi:hypothetical protein